MGMSLGGSVDPSLSPGPAGAVGFGCLDGCFRYVWLNESLARLNGQPVAAHVGRPVDQVGEGMFKPILPVLQGLASGGAADWQGELWREAGPASGGPRCHRVALIPRREPGGALQGVALLAADITGEKTAAWDLAERFHEQRMWADLSARFEAGGGRQWAHELRNRLMPMLTVAQMLRHAGGLDPATLEWAAQSLEKKIGELTGLANSLQELGAFSACPPRRRPGPMDFRELAAHALASVRPLLAWRGLSPPRQGAWVLGDPARLVHPVALCLLKAARRAGTLAVEIRVEPGHALLVMVGEGAGEGVFRDGGYPGGGDPGGEGAGSPPGMGLMLAKMLAEEQGGSLSVRGAEAGNPGCEIRLGLPLADPAAFLPG